MSESDVSNEEISESDDSESDPVMESDADSEICSPAPSASSMLHLLRSARDLMLATDGDSCLQNETQFLTAARAPPTGHAKGS